MESLDVAAETRPRPVPPPPIDGAVAELATQNPRRFVELLQMNIGATPGGKYLHWNDLRLAPALPGLTHQEMWVCVKMARRLLYKGLPIRDTAGEPFVYAVPDVAQRLLMEVDRRGTLQFPSSRPLAQITSPQTRETYLLKTLVEESIRSSQLEGAATTRDVAKDMIQQGREPRTKDERMILNNYMGMRFIRDAVHKPLTPDLVFELHRKLMDGTTSDGIGRFRRADEEIRVRDVATGEVLHDPPHASELPERMAAMCRFANEKDGSESFIHPVVRAILLHFWLAYDHPFVDGNGRTARALFYWAMASQEYRLCEFISLSRVLKQNRQAYRDAFLCTENDGNDVTYFLVHQLEAVNRAIDELFQFLERKAEELQQVEEVIRRSPLVKEHLNARQLALVNHAIQRANYRYTIESHQNAHGVTYQTARMDLMKLEELGLLDKVKGARKKLFFVAPPDLRLRLIRQA